MAIRQDFAAKALPHGVTATLAITGHRCTEATPRSITDIEIQVSVVASVVVASGMVEARAVTDRWLVSRLTTDIDGERKLRASHKSCEALFVDAVQKPWLTPKRLVRHRHSWMNITPTSIHRGIRGE